MVFVKRLLSHEVVAGRVIAIGNPAKFLIVERRLVPVSGYCVRNCLRSPKFIVKIDTRSDVLAFQEMVGGMSMVESRQRFCA